MGRRGRGVLGAAVAVMACGGGDEAPARRVVSPLSCADATQLAVPSGFAVDDVDCVTVGAVTAPTTGEWPALPDGAPMPVRYVSPRGSAGADGGSVERASSDLAAVVAALGAGGGTVLVARGDTLVSTALSVDAHVWVVGAGASAGTTLTLSSGLTVRMGGALAAMHAAVSSGAAPTGAAMRVQAGATLSLDDVRFERVATAIGAEGGAVDAQRITVQGATSHAIDLTADARLVLRRSALREGRSTGVHGDGAQVHLRDVLIAAHEDEGVALRGGRAGDVASSCPEGGDVPDGGPVDCLERVEIRGCRAVGLYVEGTAARTPTVVLRRVSIVGTRADAAGRFGYGAVVSREARVEGDREVVSDAQMGTGSHFVANHAAGIVVSDRATATLHGARVASNDGPGVFVQSSAAVERVGYGRFDDNAALGVGVSSTGFLGAVTCNGISATRAAPLRTTTSAATMFADGVHIAGTAETGPIAVQGNQVSANERFGMVFTGALRGEVTENVLRGNRYGLGQYDTSLTLRANTDTGSAPPPALAPASPGALSP